MIRVFALLLLLGLSLLSNGFGQQKETPAELLKKAEQGDVAA